MSPTSSRAPRPGETFRDAVRAEARRLWWIQRGGWVALLVVFPLCIRFEWLRLVGLVAFAVLMVAFYRGCRRVKCPGCGKRLDYLLEDKQAMGCMGGSGLTRAAVSRKGLPENLHACPYCGHSFDAILQPPSAPSPS